MRATLEMEAVANAVAQLVRVNSKTQILSADLSNRYLSQNRYCARFTIRITNNGALLSISPPSYMKMEHRAYSITLE